MTDPLSSCTAPPGATPVFNCRVIVSGPDEQGRYHAVAAQLPIAKGEAGSEREALSQVAQTFKAHVGWHHRRSEPIPWTEPPLTAAPTDRERWIPIHL